MPGIYLRHGSNVLAMHEAPYDTEAVLQELIAEHPQMLAGEDGGDNGGNGSWLLIRREASVYDEADAASRGSLDHLFVDGDGIPTLVEVKRSTDTRIRREVVGQMLDYAANAAHWTVEQIQAWLAERCRVDGLDVDEALSDHVDEPGVLWEQVRTNLAAGRLRLVFVADEIPPAVRRIVEFLNGQMTECEVVAIEVRQYIGSDPEQKIIVPRVLGQTEAARQVKGKREVRRWNRDSVMADLEAKRGAAEAQAARRILEWADQQAGLKWLFGHGAVDGSVQFGVHDERRRIFPFVIYTNGAVEIPFSRMANHAPFADESLRAAYLERLNAIPGIQLVPDAYTKRPSIPLELLADPTRIEAFLAVVQWALSQAAPQT